MLKEDEVAKQRGFLVPHHRDALPPVDIWSPLNAALRGAARQVGRRHNLPDAVVRDMRTLISTQQRGCTCKLTSCWAPSPQRRDGDDAAEAA